MLFSSSTDVFSNLSYVANFSIAGISSYIVLIAGVILALFVIERIITAIFPKNYTSNNNLDDI